MIRSKVAEIRAHAPDADEPIGLYIPHAEPGDADELFGSLPPIGPAVLSYFSERTAHLLQTGRPFLRRSFSCARVVTL